MDNAYNIYVDSALRSSGTNADFTFQTTPNNSISSKAKVAIQSVTMNNTIYQINNTNDILNYSVTTAGPTTNYYSYTAPDGNWTITELLTNLRSGMNSQTFSNNTSIPMPAYNVYNNKIQIRKHNPGEAGALPGEVSATYTLLSTSPMKGILGFENNVSFGNGFVTLPNQINLRPIDYFYLTSPNVQSSSFAPNIGGNGIIARIRVVSSRFSVQYFDNDNMFENLATCSYIPMQWTFKMVDKYGQSIDLGGPITFTLRIFPE